MTDIKEDDPIALAGEFVMGTLTLEQQQQVKEDLAFNPELKHWVHYWESQLPKFYQGIETEQPARQVWKKIQQQIKSDKPKQYTWQRLPWWQGLFLWRGLALASMIGLISLTVLLQYQWLEPISPIITVVQKPAIPIAAPSYVAVMRDDKTQARWHISVYLPAKRLFITALKDSDLPQEKDYELWLLSKDKNTAPRSMGLLPAQGSEKLPLDLSAALSQAAGLAVSIEPRGGSLLAVPSGPVVFQSGLEQII